MLKRALIINTNRVSPLTAYAGMSSVQDRRPGIQSCTDVGLMPQYFGSPNRITDLPLLWLPHSAGTLAVWYYRPSGCQLSPTGLVGPWIWNNILADVTSAESFSTFHQWLNTHIFLKSCPGYFLRHYLTFSRKPSLYYLDHYKNRYQLIDTGTLLLKL